MRWKPCAAVVLAAGRGTRFGGGKMLAELDGRPMLQHVLDLAAAVELDPVVVVLGSDADAVERAISWRREVRVRNPDPGRGISSSLKLGLASLGGADRVLVLLGDQPYLTPGQVRLVLAASDDPGRPIVLPRYADGRPGNPVLLERAAFPLAMTLEGDRGMSQLFAQNRQLVSYVDVDGENLDIDAVDDLETAARTAAVAHLVSRGRSRIRSESDRVRSTYEAELRASPYAREAIQHLLRDTNRDVRAYAVRAAQGIVGQAAVAALMPVATADRDIDTRSIAWAAIEDLDETAFRSLVPTMITTLMRSKDLYGAGKQAMLSLAKLRSEEAIRPLRTFARRHPPTHYNNRMPLVVADYIEQPNSLAVRIRAHDHDFMFWLIEAAFALALDEAQSATWERAELDDCLVCRMIARDQLKTWSKRFSRA